MWLSARLWSTYNLLITIHHAPFIIELTRKRFWTKASATPSQTYWNISDCLSIVCSCHAGCSHKLHFFGPAILQITGQHISSHFNHDVKISKFVFFIAPDSFKSVAYTHHFPSAPCPILLSSSLQTVSFQINCSPLSVSFSVWQLTSTSIYKHIQ